MSFFFSVKHKIENVHAAPLCENYTQKNSAYNHKGSLYD